MCCHSQIKPHEQYNIKKDREYERFFLTPPEPPPYILKTAATVALLYLGLECCINRRFGINEKTLCRTFFSVDVDLFTIKICMCLMGEGKIVRGRTGYPDFWKSKSGKQRYSQGEINSHQSIKYIFYPFFRCY